MYEIDSFKFKEQIQLFRNTVAPMPHQMEYLVAKREEVRKELMGLAQKTGAPLERVLLTAICGNLTPRSSKREQAEFASRLLLLEILTE